MDLAYECLKWDTIS